jgi:hypothetical protein
MSFAAVAVIAVIALLAVVLVVVQVDVAPKKTALYRHLWALLAFFSYRGTCDSLYIDHAHIWNRHNVFQNESSIYGRYTSRACGFSFPRVISQCLEHLRKSLFQAEIGQFHRNWPSWLLLIVD